MTYKEMTYPELLRERKRVVDLTKQGGFTRKQNLKYLEKINKEIFKRSKR